MSFSFLALKESEIANCGQPFNAKWPLQPIFERVRRVTDENVWPVAHSARASDADAHRDRLLLLVWEEVKGG